MLELLLEGLSQKEIAQRLGLRLSTVRNHCHELYQRYDVDSALQLVSRVWKERAAAGAPPFLARLVALEERLTGVHVCASCGEVFYDLGLPIAQCRYCGRFEGAPPSPTIPPGWLGV